MSENVGFYLVNIIGDFDILSCLNWYFYQLKTKFTAINVN